MHVGKRIFPWYGKHPRWFVYNDKIFILIDDLKGTVAGVEDSRLKKVLGMGAALVDILANVSDEWIKAQGVEKGGMNAVDHSLQKAAGLGFGAVLFEGNIAFYGKSGFDYAEKFGIRYHDLPEGADASFFLCKELIPGYLSGVTGVYQTPQGYYVDDSDVEEFDKAFPPREKLRLPGQIF